MVGHYIRGDLFLNKNIKEIENFKDKQKLQ